MRRARKRENTKDRDEDEDEKRKETMIWVTLFSLLLALGTIELG